MSRSWAEFLGDGSAAPEPDDASSGWFRRLRESLSASREALTSELTSVFDPTDDEAWERVEEALIRLSDVREVHVHVEPDVVAQAK